MTKDLGTYYARIEFKSHRGYIDTFNTGHRYSHGTPNQSPLDAMLIKPVYDDEEDLIRNIIFMYIQGNYSCDCNRLSFIARAHQEEPDDFPCGDETVLKKITLIRPDMTEKVIYE